MFRGIIPPLITPLSDPETIDVEGLERLVEHVVDGGVHGLFVLGTSGEAPALGYGLRREVIGRVCRQVAGRLPVLAGVSDTAFCESVELARYAAEAGASAAVTAAPYYYPLEQGELAEHFIGLARAIPLPLMLYNMPTMTKVSLEPETVRRLSAEPRIVGLKDSSRRMEYFVAVRRVTLQRPDWSLLVGFEHMLADALRAGGDGGVLAGANFSPRLLVDLYQAALAGDEARVRRLHERLAVQRRIYTLAEGTLASVRGIKCALALRGICRDAMARPLAPLAARQRCEAAAILAELDGG